MKKVLIILAILTLIAVVSSCGTNTADMTTSTQKHHSDTPIPAESVKIEKNIDAVAEVLGFENGSETLYSMIGAIDGKEYNNGSVELYQFDENDSTYKQMIGENSPLNISAYKDGIVLLFPAGQTPDDTIIDKFNSIKFK